MKKLKRIVVTIFIILLITSTYVTTRVNYLEYKELGENYISIFKTNTTYKYTIMLINFIVVFIVMYFANRGIKKGLKIFFEQEKKEMPELVNKSLALVIAVITSIVVGIAFTPKIILSYLIK